MNQEPRAAKLGRVSWVNGYDGQAIEIRRSRGAGAVAYAISWEDNVLPPPIASGWPVSLLRQVRGYVAQPSWFSPADATALAAKLGRISKFQSLRSEDAVTWSWFGTLALAGAETRQRAVQWLYNKAGLLLSASTNISIDQWSRVAHPNAPGSPHGPEIDARIDDSGVALVYVEAKWEATLGTGKGATVGSRDDQVVLRRDSFRGDPVIVSPVMPSVWCFSFVVSSARIFG